MLLLRPCLCAGWKQGRTRAGGVARQCQRCGSPSVLLSVPARQVRGSPPQLLKGQPLSGDAPQTAAVRRCQTSPAPSGSSPTRFAAALGSQGSGSGRFHVPNMSVAQYVDLQQPEALVFLGGMLAVKAAATDMAIGHSVGWDPFWQVRRACWVPATSESHLC